MTLLSKINALLATVGQALQPLLLLVIRLYWGCYFVVTGRGHLLNLERTAHYFTSLGIPAPKLNAIMDGGTEAVGGALLALGLFSRFASPVLVTCMCVAYATAERDSLHTLFSNPDKFTGADPFLFLYAALIVFVFGPGKIALDTFVFKDRKA
jgi:putative oxidoreductase